MKGIPQVNNINLYQAKGYENLSLLEDTASELVKKEKIRKMSMKNDDCDDPDSFSYLKKATILTGNHFKARSRAQSENVVDGMPVLPKEIQKIIEGEQRLKFRANC